MEQVVRDRAALLMPPRLFTHDTDTVLDVGADIDWAVSLRRELAAIREDDNRFMVTPSYLERAADWDVAP